MQITKSVLFSVCFEKFGQFLFYIKHDRKFWYIDVQNRIHDKQFVLRNPFTKLTKFTSVLVTRVLTITRLKKRF